MKVFCHIPRENWFCDRYGKEYQKFSSHSVTFNDLDSDLYWLLAGWCWRQIDPKLLSLKKVICTIHHEVPWKFDNNRLSEFMERDRFVDAYHVPCFQTEDFIRKITKKPIIQISYWANNHLWKDLDNAACKKKYGVSDKFVISSFQRDTEGGDLKSPKLEKGPDRFCDFVKKFSENSDKEVHVLLNGWRRQYVISRLESYGINYSYYELPDFDEIVDMYNATDLYVVGSRVEGGPQSIIECALTKTPIISTNVGIARNILPESCIINMDSDYDIFIPGDDCVQEAYRNIQKILIESHVEKYDKLFEKVLMEI